MLRPLSGVRVYDLVTASAQAFARDLEGALGLPIRVADSVEEAVGTADIVLSATWAREPFLRLEMLKPGAHVTTLGPDEPGKAEVSAEVIQASLFVCDDRDLAVEMGAVGGVGLGESAVAAELGEVLGGRHPGRTDDAQLTVFGGVGLAFQDAVAAWAVYAAARRSGAGTEVDFLA
jgi:ornithine cyclodeaminase